MKSILLLISLFISGNDEEAFKQLSLLKGSWKMKTEKGIIYEQWKIDHAGLMTGRGYRVQALDTTMKEHIVLQKTDSGIHYIVTTEDQNDQKPVSFKLINSKNKMFIFENKQHDFPKRIIYSLINNDSVVARIEGDIDGKMSAFDFNFSRIE